jgi:predicted secreted protein
MTKAICVFFLIVTAAFLAACVETGEGLAIIELEGNSAADYSWTYTMSPEGIVIESAKGRRQKGNESRAEDGGSFLFVFEAVAQGETEIRFSYGRQLENEEPVQTAVYILKTHGDGTITVKKL